MSTGRTDRAQLLELLSGTLDEDESRTLHGQAEAGALDELLSRDDPELSSSFARLARTLSEDRSPTEQETEDALARFRSFRAREDEAQELARSSSRRESRSPLALRRAEPADRDATEGEGLWAWLVRTLTGRPLRLLIPIGAAAALLLIATVKLEPGGSSATSPAPGAAGLKGDGRPNIALELLTNDPLRPRALSTPYRAEQSQQLVPRVELQEELWLYLVHRGPDGAVQVQAFGPRAQGPGRRVPLDQGRVLAYDPSGEPGVHGFTVLGSRKPLSEDAARQAALRGEEELAPDLARAEAEVEIFAP